MPKLYTDIGTDKDLKVAVTKMLYQVKANTFGTNGHIPV